MSRAPASRTRTRARRCALAAALLPACSALAAEPVVTAGELSMGYDSNPAQSRDGPELAFALYSLDVSGGVEYRGADLDFGANAWYRDYEGGNDSHRLVMGAGWSRETRKGLGLLSVSAEGGLYRDQLVPADERDEAAVAARYDLFLTGRDELRLTGELRWLSYRNPSLPWAGRPGSGPGPFSGGSQGRPSAGQGPPPGAGPPGGREPAAVRRDDRLATVGIVATRYWTPTLSGSVDVGYSRRKSPVALEAYDQYAAGLVGRFDPTPAWGLEIGLGWFEARYDRGPRGLERDDRRLSAGVSLRRTLSDGELFCAVNHLDNASTVDEKSFRQTVTHCGFAWTF